MHTKAESTIADAPAICRMDGKVESNAFIARERGGTSQPEYLTAFVTIEGQQGGSVVVTSSLRDIASPAKHVFSFETVTDADWNDLRVLLLWALDERERLMPLARELNREDEK